METWEEVLAALDQTRPALLADGGDVELVEVNDGVIRVRLHGACRECPAREHTLLHIVMRAVKERVPSARAVLAVP
ncbi:MAG: NifU family protein [Deltaproteobacteria bacterium]|nr:NifU family protein [Deltaproteobacteria bacterium]